jgi:hypothetical protein
VYASEEQHAVGPEDFRTRKPTSTARGHLVSTAEEVAHRFVDVIADGPVGHQACSVAEVSGPPPQHCVEPVTDLGPRIMVAPNQKLIDIRREPPDTFLGRARAQLPTTIFAMVIWSKRVAKEVEVFLAGILQRGFRLVEC